MIFRSFSRYFGFGRRRFFHSDEAFGLVENDVATEGKGHHRLRREMGGRLERSGIIDNGQHHGIALFGRKITQVVEPREVENEAFAGVHAPRAARSFVGKIRRGHRIRWVKNKKIERRVEVEKNIVRGRQRLTAAGSTSGAFCLTAVGGV